MDLHDLEDRIRERWPVDRFFAAEVADEERSHPRRREFRHFRASEVLHVTSVGDRRLSFQLEDGEQVVVRGELGEALRLFRRLGFAFIQTHRQTIARLDRVEGIAQA